MTSPYPADRQPAPPSLLVDLGIQADPLSAAQLEHLLNSLPHAVLVKDRAHRFVLVNDEMCRLSGRAREQMLGRTDHDVVPVEQADAYWADDDVVLATGEEREVEETLTTADGSLRWLRTRKRRVILPGADGVEVPLVIASIMDITEIRRTKDALRESEAHYRYSVELNPQIPWTANAQGLVTDASPRWTALTGASVDEGRGTGWTRLLHPDDIAAAGTRWRESVESGQPFDHEYRLRLKNGEYHWFRAHAAPRRDADGRIVSWYGTLEDIQDRKLAEQALRESEAFARGVLDHSPNCIRVLDEEGRLLYVNPAAYRVLELDPQEPLYGLEWVSFLPGESQPLAAQALEVARRGGIGQFTIRRPNAEGQVQWLDTLTVAMPGEEGRPGRLLVISTDVTETLEARQAAERAQAEMRQLAERLSTVLESTTDSVMVVDLDWRVTYLNGHAVRALQPREPRLGRCLWDMFPEEADGVVGRNFRRAMADQRPVTFEEYLPGLAIWLEVHAYPTAGGMSIFFRNITERRRAEQERLVAQERIAHMARHDPLTGLPNRMVLRQEIQHALRESRKGASAALFQLDLKGFKAVNDAFGQPAGDALLRQAANRLRACVRGTDSLARLGADEFAIVQTPLFGYEAAEQLARELIRALDAPFEMDGQRLSIGVSVGVAMIPQDGQAIDDLVRAADIALHRAEQETGSAYCFFRAGIDDDVRIRMATRRALHEAIDRGQFLLHYQPLHSLANGEITGFEALLRWYHPERGMVSPADFVPLAEETGLIVPIGKWALEEACRQAVRWPERICVAVNLSPVQFRDPDLVKCVCDALEASGLQPSRLQLEVTESVMLQQNLTNLSVLQTLRGLGVHIAMDDFGTGYSSLSYLRNFPFDKIKLDRSFVNDLHNGHEARAILHAVAGLGSGFNIRTTAEGIETVEQLQAVRDEGYDEGQGYLFSPPVPAERTAELIEAARRRPWWTQSPG